MKKSLLITFVVFLIISSSAAYSADINSPLLAKANSIGTVRVIVKLKVADYQPENKLSSVQTVTNQHNAIAQTQQQLVNNLTNYSLAGVKKFTTIPYIAMQVNAAGLKALLDNPAVVRIEEDVADFPTLNESIPLIQADQVHAKGFDGTGWTVAILDSGVRKTHEFLDSGKVVSEACYSTTDSNYGSTSVCPGGVSASTATDSGVNCSTTIDDVCSHGTHVAGIATGKDGSAVNSGVAPGANVIAIQVFSRFDNPAICRSSDPCILSYTSDQLLALERVYELRSTYNIAAINMSLGGGLYSTYCDTDSRKDIIDNLRTAGIATVIASGNNSWDGYTGAPGCISSAVTVGATLDTEDSLSSYSNNSSMVDLLAPGSDITSSTATSDASYATWNGTSMATPHVAGAFAVMKSVNSSWSVDDIEELLKKSGVPVSRAGITKPRIDLLTAAGLADDDRYEENDTLATAYDLSSNRGQWLYSVGKYGIQKDDDWYRIYVKPGRSRIHVDLRYAPAGGNIDLCLYNASGTVLQCSENTGDSESIEYTATDHTGGTYYLKVYSNTNAGNAYNLHWMTPYAKVGVLNVLLQ